MTNKLYNNVLSIILMKPAAYFVSLLSTWLVQSAELLFVMTVFVLIDLFTGVWKSLKMHGLRSITSRGLRRTVEKFTGYSFIIVLGLILDKSILNIEWFSLIKIFSGLIMLSEFKSITENLAVITENKVFTTIYEYANKIFTKKIDVKNEKN